MVDMILFWLFRLSHYIQLTSRTATNFVLCSGMELGVRIHIRLDIFPIQLALSISSCVGSSKYKRSFFFKFILFFLSDHI